MYDWPEVREATDELWHHLRDELRAAGFAAPADLHRGPREVAWTSPALLVGQTCGLPFVQGVREHATVLGAWDHHLDGCSAGEYRSVVVARPGGAGGGIEGTRGGVVAFNAPDSQSGHAALLAEVAPLARGGRFFAGAVETGSHRASIVAVRDGVADLAAIDAVSWELAREHEPAAAELTVVAHTRPRPALPLITSRRHATRRDDLVGVLGAAVAGLEAELAATLRIHGFVERTDRDYDVLAAGLAGAHALGYRELA